MGHFSSKKWVKIRQKQQYIVLIQHGILPDTLHLHYKLKNINEIYYYNEKSKAIFKEIFDCKDVKFKKFVLSLNLSDIKSDKKTILIIGQPHSIDMEINIAKSLIDDYELYIKPHPLYSNKKYKSIKGVKIITDRNFYPRVDLALCYESTLGLEYEASGINVIWWKGLDIKNIFNVVNREGAKNA